MFFRILNKMGFEGFSSSKWPPLVRDQRSKSLPDNKASEENNSVQCLPYNKASEENNSVQSTEVATNASKLDTKPSPANDCTDSKKKASSNAETETQLRQEIHMLEKRLQDQVSVRCALENTLGYTCRNCAEIITDASVIHKTATELIKEISELEVEVGHLEHHLLSLYRTTFDSLSPPNKHQGFQTQTETALPNLNGPYKQKLLISNVQRSLSAPSPEAMAKPLLASHSQPINMMEISTPSEASSRKEETSQTIPSTVSDDHNTPNTKRKRSDVIGDDSERVPSPDAYKNGPDTFDSTRSQKKEISQAIPGTVNKSNAKKKTSGVKKVLGSGPWTRSRTRNATKAK